MTASNLAADQVGSLLRPVALRNAAEGTDLDRMRRAQDAAIDDALATQVKTGIDVLCDGEFRRRGFLTGVMDAVDGFGERVPITWKGGDTPGNRSMLRFVVAPLESRRRIADVEATYLREHAPQLFKITLPSPSTFAINSWHSELSSRAYPTREGFLEALTEILAQEARQLDEDGVPYIQLDAPNYTWWVDGVQRQRLESNGIDLDGFLDRLIEADNHILAQVHDATTGVHLCRGNQGGRWIAEGGYDIIAERLFTGLRTDRLLLEYDTVRAGSFGPLASVPTGRVAVLGLVSTKHGDLESRDELHRRIEDASAFIPLEQLALSPQCGFASVAEGNPITEAEQWRKLQLVADVAHEIWPSPLRQ